MQGPKEEIIATLKKLFSITVENGATEGEARNATRLAQKILAEHDMTVDEVTGTVTLDGSAVRQDIILETLYKHAPDYLIVLGRCVSRAFECRMITGWHQPDGSYLTYDQFTIIGMPIDVELAVYFFCQLRVKLLVQAISDYEKYRQKHERRETFIHSFICGAAETLLNRLQSERESRIQSDPKFGQLVVLKKAMVNQTVSLHFPTLVSGRSGTSKHSSNAAALGREAGAKIPLHRGVSGSVIKPRYLK